MNNEESYVKNLIEKFAEKVGVGTTWKGFEQMSLELFEQTQEKITPRYLKYTLYDGKRLPNTKTRVSNLDIIAKFVAGTNYRTFCENIDSKVDSVLKSIVGNYYCFVRMNHEEANLLRSPVKITLSNGHVYYHQKGGRLQFTGEIQKHEGCLFVLMQSDEGKSFYHVYRIGKRTSPEVLQGVFSGVSTDFKPIGGRAVLLRANKPFESLKTGILDIRKMLKSKREEDVALARYFQHREENNLSIKPSPNFNLRDLRDRK